MKKLLLTATLFVAGLAFVGLDNVYAGGLEPYTIEASTRSVLDASTLEVQIPGTKKVQMIVISTTDRGELQEISLYENASSTTSVTLAWKIDLPAGMHEFIKIPFEGFNNYWKCTDIAIRKSNPLSDIKITFWCR
nr:hypothetical protein 16 [Elusimicrobiota bacterium]